MEVRLQSLAFLSLLVLALSGCCLAQWQGVRCDNDERQCTGMLDMCCGTSGKCSFGAQECYFDRCSSNCWGQSDSATREQQLEWTSGCVKQNVVTFTFDDGPDPVNTPLVLDKLKEGNLKATFFLIGSEVYKYPEIVQRIIAEGHFVGSHSYSHVDPGTVSPAALALDVRQSLHAINRAAGIWTTLFRPPLGNINTTGLAALKSAGLSVHSVLWSCDTYDWKDHSLGEVVKSVERCFKPVQSPPASIVMEQDRYVSRSYDSILEAVKKNTENPIVSMSECLSRQDIHAGAAAPALAVAELPYNIAIDNSTATKNLSLPESGSFLLTVRYVCPRACSANVEVRCTDNRSPGWKGDNTYTTLTETGGEGTATLT